MKRINFYPGEMDWSEYFRLLPSHYLQAKFLFIKYPISLFASFNFLLPPHETIR